MYRFTVSTLLVVSLLLLGSCATESSAVKNETAAPAKTAVVSAVPGSFENAAPAGLPAIIALNAKLAPSADEFVVYYVRKDANYAPWALWLWAIPGGDGAVLFPKTQEWTVQDGIGYMRFKLDGSSFDGVKPTGSDGQLGMIVRQKAAWTKDGADDRAWDTNVSNVVVIFSGDSNTYAAKEYKPKALTAVLNSATEIQVQMSGRYALDTDGGTSGFSVVTKDGKKYPVTKVFNTESPTDLANNFARKITIQLSEAVSASDALILSNPVFEGDKKIDGTKLAVKMAEAAMPAKDAALGALYDSAEKSVSFNLWAPTSSSVSVNVYMEDSAAKADYTLPMAFNAKTGVWTAVFAELDPNGFFYDFSVTNAKGTVIALDPYARSMAAYRNQGGSGRGAIIDMKDGRSLPLGGMNASYVPLKQREDAIIYEISVRDISSSPDAGVKEKEGTYAAFIEKIPYLKSLGVTHIQLLPVVNFYFTDETNQGYENSGNVSNNNYNWGYDPHNYFTPEGWYSSDPTDPYTRVAELRTLINECHKAGLGVLLDVVYNHMAGTSFLDDIVPGYFFRINAQGKLTSNSGCGNDVATERVMARKLIVDSVRHWVTEYKVDGFRFDLMGLMDSQTVLDAYAAAKAVNPATLFEGEGWKMYNGPSGTYGMDQVFMTKTDSVSVFNDEFRNLLKAGGMSDIGQGFITKKGIAPEILYRNILGQPMLNYKADDPGDNLQYIVAHDGLTLHDTISYNAKLDDSIPEQKVEIAKRIKLGNFFVLTSQGVSFLHGGQERGRTKPNFNNSKNETIGKYVRNSYDSSDNINQIVWKLDSEYAKVLDYTKGMIALRNGFDVFRIGDMAKINAASKLLASPGGSMLTIGYTIDWTDGKWFMLVNAEPKPMTFDVVSDVSGATVFADASGADVAGIKSPSGIKLAKNLVTVDALTAVAIRVAK